MHWEWTTASIALLATSGLSLAVATSLFRRRSIPGAPALAFAMLAVAEWALVAGLEAAAIPLDIKILFSKLEYVGSGSSAVLFLLFAFRYTHRTARMSRPRVAAVWLLPLVSVFLATTNAQHRLLWTAFTPGPAGSNTLLYSHGPAFFLIIVWIYVYVFIASLFLVISAVRSSTIQRRQSITILIAIAFPWISGILYALDITLAPGLNLTPVSFVVTGAVFAVGILPLRLFELVPVARDLLIDGMTDGVLVVDAAHRIIDVNPAARALFDLPQRIIGKSAEVVLADWPQIARSLSADRDAQFELTLSGDPMRHVDLRVEPLRRRPRGSAGFLIVLRDITQRYLAESALQAVNERLQSHVREIERLQDELREQAMRDALTGLFNRRHLDDMLPRVLERAARDGAPVAVILFDIDHFKQVNDSRGHLAGDALLEKLGSLLARRTRPADIACRYGGEEFLLVLPDAPLDAAVERAEALRRDVCALEIPQLASDRPPTLSAGIAIFPGHGATQDELVHAADDALYRAKQSGRDCVRTAGDRPE